MSVYRRKDTGHWAYRKRITLPDGSKKRIKGQPSVNTKRAAELAERAHIERLLNPPLPPAEPEPEPEPAPPPVPTFGEWFSGRWWTEHVIAEGHAPRTREQRETLYRVHLADSIGDLRLNEIDVGVVQRLKAELAAKPGRGREQLSDSTRHAVLTIVAKALSYAEVAGVIDRAPPVKPPKVRPPDIEVWGFDQHLALLAAAEQRGFAWYVAALLAGDAGLRIGEIAGLQWADIDFAGSVLTVRRQRDKTGAVGPPKGKRSRTVPLSSTLSAALSASPGEPGAWVTPLRPRRLHNGSRPLCRRAGLELVGWHRLRHTFGTNCARFKVGVWELRNWLGHASVTTTERYVHLADAHRRELPGRVVAALDDGAIAAIGALSAPSLPSGVVPIRVGPRRARGSGEGAGGLDNGS